MDRSWYLRLSEQNLAGAYPSRLLGMPHTAFQRPQKKRTVLLRTVLFFCCFSVNQLRSLKRSTEPCSSAAISSSFLLAEATSWMRSGAEQRLAAPSRLCYNHKKFKAQARDHHDCRKYRRGDRARLRHPDEAGGSGHDASRRGQYRALYFTLPQGGDGRTR